MVLHCTSSAEGAQYLLHIFSAAIHTTASIYCFFSHCIVVATAIDPHSLSLSIWSISINLLFSQTVLNVQYFVILHFGLINALIILWFAVAHILLVRLKMLKTLYRSVACQWRCVHVDIYYLNEVLNHPCFCEIIINKRCHWFWAYSYFWYNLNW